MTDLMLSRVEVHCVGGAWQDNTELVREDEIADSTIGQREIKSKLRLLAVV